MNAQFFQQMGSPGIFVDDPEYKPDIYTYTFVVIRMEIKGSCHGFPVSVVCQTDKFSPAFITGLPELPPVMSRLQRNPVCKRPSLSA